MPTIPLIYHVAEKVQAYTRHYGLGGRASTRVKDLVDLVLIATEKTNPLAAGGVDGPLSQNRRRGGACER